MRTKTVAIFLVIFSLLFTVTGCHKDTPTTRNSESLVEQYKSNNPQNKENYDENFFEDISEIDKVVGTYQDEEGNIYLFNNDGTCEYNVRNQYDTNMIPVKFQYTVREEALYIDTGNYVDIYTISFADNTIKSLLADKNTTLTKTSKD